jgi:hypothetical protein
MSELRVPPAVTMKFENTAHYVCNKAKLDFDAWPLHIHEFVTHLQDRWREGIELGLDTDQAEERALQLFGNLNKVAQGVRKHWLKRLIYDDRCKVNRYFIVLLDSVLVSTLTFYLYLTRKHQPTFDSDEVMQLYGAYFNGFIGMGSVAIIRWKPNIKYTILRWIYAIRYVFIIFVLTCFINITLYAYLLFYFVFKRFDIEINYLTIFWPHLIAVLLGTLAAVCMISELFNLPARAKKKQGRSSRVIAV